MEVGHAGYRWEILQRTKQGHIIFYVVKCATRADALAIYQRGGATYKSGDIWGDLLPVTEADIRLE